MKQVKINLLKFRRSVSEEQYDREKHWFRLILGGLIGVVVVTVGVWGVNLWYSQALEKVERGIATATRELANSQEVNVKQIYLKSRLALVSEFLAGRAQTREALSQVFSLEIPGVIVSGVTLETEELLAVQLTAENAVKLARVIEYYREEQYFVQVVSEGIVRTKEGEYQLKLSLYLPQEST